MKQFFVGSVLLELQLNDDALKVFQDLADIGFQSSPYIVSSIAVAFHNMRGELVNPLLLL